MTDRYFVDGAKVGELQTVYIRRKEERIILIGTQRHRPIKGPKSFIGSIILDVNKWSKMMFVHQALRTVLLNKDQEWTILLCTQGYEKKPIETIKEYFNKILKTDGSKTVRYIKEISNLGEILSYINQGDKKTNRNRYMITSLIFYSHGDVQGISPWMGNIPLSTDPYIDKQFIAQIESYAFDFDAKIYSFACRTGLGNPKIDESANGKDPMIEKSIAQAFANQTNAIVYAYMRRTWYGDSLLNGKERADVENYSSLSEFDQQKYKLLYDIWMTKKYEVDGEILYPYGARYPVRAAETPEGLTSDMVMYERKL